MKKEYSSHRLLLSLLLLLVGTAQGWAGGNNTYYAKLNAIATPTGAGKVYVSTSNSTDGARYAETSSNTGKAEVSWGRGGSDPGKADVTLYAFAQANDGYRFKGWSATETGAVTSTSTSYSTTITSTSDDTSSPTSQTIYAQFVKIVDVTITFLAPEHGSYTASDGSTTVTNSGSITTQNAFTLKATPASGYKIYGWYTTTDGGKTKQYFSTDATVTGYSFTESISVGVDFVTTGTPVFIIKGSTTPYTDLNAADKAAGGGVIILVSDATLPAGDYTISKGNTLLIPFDADYTCYTTTPVTVYNQAIKSAYRTLSLAKGASITVNGSISVSAKMRSAGGGQEGGGSPCGQFGLIKMAEGSEIIVNNGGNLYCWGYISGDGAIEAKNGAKVYEGYQINDFRGGTATTAMSNSNKVLPFNQYYIQNIEPALTLNYGALEHIYSSLYAGSTILDTDFDLIGSSAGMFRLTESGAKLVKRYNALTDMLEITLSGATQMSSVTINFGSILNINSSSYVLPVNDMDITIENGTTTINQDLALLPGTKLLIMEGANLAVASEKNLYVYDLDEWGQYAGAGTKLRPVIYTAATGKKGSRTEASLVDAKINVEGTITGTGNIYTTASGADICSSGYGKVVLSTVPSSGSTYQYTQSGTSVTLHTISVTAPQLENADGSYVKTAGASAGTTYYYSPYDGVWQTSAPVATEYDFSGHKLSTKDGKPFVTKSNLASAMTSTVGSGTLLSADFTNAKSNLSVTEMREQIGAKDGKDGNNILLYTTAKSDGAANVVVKTDDSYTAQSLVITDKQPMDVPTAFTATNVTYDRTSSSKWGTVCVPYQLTSGNGIQYYKLDKVEGSTMYFTTVETVAANQPAIYSVGADGTTISFGGGTDVEVSTTETNDVTSGSLTLVGVQTESKSLPVSSSSPYYYIASNKFWQPTKNAVSVRPQRAYFKTKGAASLAKVLSIGVSDDAATGISSAETAEPTVVGIYTLGGAKLNTIEKGVNIVKMSDGSTRKIIVR